MAALRAPGEEVGWVLAPTRRSVGFLAWVQTPTLLWIRSVFQRARAATFARIYPLPRAVQVNGRNWVQRRDVIRELSLWPGGWLIFGNLCVVAVAKCNMAGELAELAPTKSRCVKSCQ